MRFYEGQQCEWCNNIKICVKIIGLDQELAKQNIYEDKVVTICPQCIHDTYEEEHDPEFRRAQLHLVE